MGKLSMHGVKQVDRLLSKQGVDVWEFFGYWVAYMVGARSEVVVALEWDELRARRTRDDCDIDADGSWTCDPIVVEDGAGIDVEGQT